MRICVVTQKLAKYPLASASDLLYNRAIRSRWLAAIFYWQERMKVERHVLPSKHLPFFVSHCLVEVRVVKRFLRSTPRVLVSVGVLAAMVAVAVFAMTGKLSFASPRTHSSAAMYSASRGHSARVSVVYIQHLPLAARSNTSGSKVTPHVAPLRLQPKHAGATRTGVSHAPSATGVRVSGTGKLLTSFDGVNEIQNNAASATPLEPPDEGLATDGHYVGNFVNVTGDFYTTSGTPVVPPFALYALFAEPSTAFLSDPRIFYDSSTHTWFATLFEFSLTESHLDIAVNTGNPITNPWLVYRIDTTEAQDAGCPCLPDFDQFGIDQNNIYISSNEFPISGPGFNGAEIFAISKSQLEAGVAANYVRFGELSMAGAPAYHVQPAISYGNPSAEYFLNSLDPNSTFDNRLGVWAMTNTASVTTGVGMPALSSIVIGSEAYGFPVNVPTPPGYNSFVGDFTTGVVTPDFDAMQEVQYINGHLDGALNTAITIPGDTSERDGVAWFQVTPKLSSGVIASGTKVSHQGYLSASGEYLIYPHINEGKDGNMALTFTIASPNTFLSAAYSVKGAHSSNFGVINIYGAGTGPDNGFTMTPEFGGVGRWGDYSNGEINTSNGTVWLASEYIPNPGDQFANWGNRICELSL